MWDYIVHWEAAIPGQADETVVQYTIGAWSEDGPELFADWPDVDDQVHHAVMVHYGTLPKDTPLISTEHYHSEGVFNYHLLQDQIVGGLTSGSVKG